MFRYYFDTEDLGMRSTDEKGVWLDDDAAARKSALAALPDMAREPLPDGDHRQFRVDVRDENGDDVYRVTLALTGEWRRRRRA